MRQHKLALGTVQFGLDYGISNQLGITVPGEVKAILETCRQNGITILDTASAYGEAEKILGEIGVTDFQIVSKFMPTKDAEAIERQLGTTLRQLGTQQLYGYLAHRPVEILNHPWTWDLLQQKKEEGLIKKLGFSLNSPSELYELLDAGYIPDLVQVPYNYLDRRFEPEFANLKKVGTEIHTRSTFLQGLFFMKPLSLPAFFDSIKPILQNMEEIENLPGELFAFVADHSLVDKVVMGINSLSQLIENINQIAIASGVINQRSITKIDEQLLMPSYWPK